MILRVVLLLLLLGLLARLLKGKISLAFLFSALAAGPLLGIGLSETATNMALSAVSAQSLRLILFVEAIMVLGGLMAAVGSLSRIGDAVRGFLGTARGGMGLLPPLVGLLPMPGGALFSAPLVDAAAAGTDINKTRRAVSNFWFRHIWEFWWPLYPGVVAALALSGISWSTWTAKLLILTPVAALVGWVFILGPVAKQDISERRDKRDGWALLLEMLPIFVVPTVVLLSGMVTVLFPLWTPDSWFVLLAGVITAIAWVTVTQRPGFKQWRIALNRDEMLSMAFLLFALMAYKGVIAESNLASGMAEELSHVSFSIVLIASIITFVGGLVTGIAVGFVGATFPIVVVMLSSAETDYTISMGIAYVWGFMGMMVSPMHLCLLVTKEYFQADWKPIYRLLIPVALVTGLLSTGLLMAFQLIGDHANAPNLTAVQETVELAGVLRKERNDRLFSLHWPGRINTPLFRDREGMKRWPHLAPDGESVAFLERRKSWGLSIGGLMGGKTTSVADDLAGERVWGAWSHSSPLRFAASCVHEDGERGISVWEQGLSSTASLSGTRGAMAPFWSENRLLYFVPGDKCWEIGSWRSGIGETSILCTGLPELEPRECDLSPNGRQLAYIGVDGSEQPPAGRLFLLSMGDWELQEIDAEGASISAPAWSDSGHLHFLEMDASGQRLTAFSLDDQQKTGICSLDVRIVGATVLPEKELLIGITPRKGAGSDYDLVIVGYDGKVIDRFRKWRSDFWGITVAG